MQDALSAVYKGGCFASLYIYISARADLYIFIHDAHRGLFAQSIRGREDDRHAQGTHGYGFRQHHGKWHEPPSVHGGCTAQPCGRVLGLEYEHHALLCASQILYLADGLRVVFGLLFLAAYRHAVPQLVDSYLDVFGQFQSWPVGRIWSSLASVAATIPTVANLHGACSGLPSS